MINKSEHKQKTLRFECDDMICVHPQMKNECTTKDVTKCREWLIAFEYDFCFDFANGMIQFDEERERERDRCNDEDLNKNMISATTQTPFHY